MSVVLLRPTIVAPNVAQTAPVKLTDAAVRALRPREKRYEIRDTEVRGLALRVSKAGRKTWVIVARFGRHPARRKLGEYPTLSLRDARLEAMRWRTEMAAGRDPMVPSVSHGQTFGEVAENYFADIKRRGLRRAHEVERDIKRDLAGWWHRPIAAIDRNDVLHVIRQATDRGTFAAHHVFSYISRVLGWAVERGVIKHSPCHGLRPSRLIGEKRPRERVLNNDELRALWNAAGQLGYPGGPFVRMLLLTGQRRGEVGGMRWSEIHGAQWVIPGERMKMKTAHTVPLVPEVLALLAELPRRGDFVFTNDGRRAVNGHDHVKQKLDALMPAGIPGWVFHDLRRTCRSGLSACRVPTEVAERVLAHAPRGLLRIYDQHDYLDEKREGLEAWTARLLRIVKK